jgi:hypothetical protein
MKFVIAITLSFFALFANAAGVGYATKYSSVAIDTGVSVTEKLIKQEYSVFDKVVDPKIIKIYLYNHKTEDAVLITVVGKGENFLVHAVSKNPKSPAIKLMIDEIPESLYEIKGVTRVVKN